MIFKTFCYKESKMLALNKGKCHKKLKLRPRQLHTYTWFTLLRWDPVTLKKDEDEKQNSNKQLLWRRTTTYQWCAGPETSTICCSWLSLIYLSFFYSKDGLETRTHIH